MRVKAYPVDRQLGSGAIRMRLPVEALAERGYDVQVVYREEGANPLARLELGGWLTVPEIDADVVVLQRCSHALMPAAIEVLQSRGIACVVEVDDDFSTIDPRHSAYARYHPQNSPDYNFQHIAAAARIADLVVCTTPALARRYGAHGRVAVIPNYVPDSYLDLPTEPADPDRTVIGWTGTVSSHPGDLDVTRGAVAQVLRDTGAEFYAFGFGLGVREGLRLDAEVSSPGRILSLDEYALEIGRLDIGIAPLALTAFNQAKSGWKQMEYGARRRAGVGSPTFDNRRLAKLGVGLIAEKPRDWQRLLTRLVRDKPWREEVAERSYEAMRTQTIRGHAEEWWAAWTLARVNRHRARKRAEAPQPRHARQEAIASLSPRFVPLSASGVVGAAVVAVDIRKKGTAG